ncbi:MAG: hypothetical protein J7M40_20180, partial [Planctomycetes bacterium]|nr:hypothetical protein [Planctomycetota bacterium]
MIRKNSVFLIAAIIALAASTTPAAELHVGPGETYTTIQSAIDTAEPNDIVIVADGTYTGDGNRDLDFNGKAITVRSQNGPENCIVDCQGTSNEPHRGFHFHSGEDVNSRIEGLTITGGYSADNGGAFLCVGGSP